MYWYQAAPLVLALVLVRPTNAQMSATERETSGENKCTHVCPQEKARPVCGSDGRTYFSKCELERQIQCEGNTARIKHKGKCAEESRCRIERLRAQKSRRPQPAAFVPECREDGSYAEVQCHVPTGYCWCVTDTGMPVPGSSVTNRRPICNHNNGKPNNTKRRSSRGRSDRKGCSQVDRTTFNTNLVKIFLSEYNRLPTSSPPTGKSISLLDSHEKRAVEWKFAQLDRNGDYELDKKESQALRRMLKKVVRPRPCARTFTRTCDQNSDKKINRSEWTLCLGVDMNNEQTEHNSRDDSSSTERDQAQGPPLWNRPFSTLSTHVRPTDTNIKVTEDDFSDCPSARQMALEEKVDGYIPECTVDGKYVKLQCYKPTGYCWCVDPDTGNTVAGTLLFQARPDCSKSNRNSKSIKGCTPHSKKLQFLNELVDSIVNEMQALNISNSEQKTDFTSNNYELREKAALQKLHILDKNKNQMIDKKEWKDFKNEIKKKKIMRKCGRNFLKYCDENNDKKVSEEEWISCLGIREINLSPKRKGKNPLEEYLNQ